MRFFSLPNLWRFSLVFGLVGGILLFSSAFRPSAVSADMASDGAVCWVSGQLGGTDFEDQNESPGKEGWGGSKEFSIDYADFWEVAGQRDVDLVPAQGYWGFFQSVAEARDFTYAMDYDDINDLSVYANNSRVGDLRHLLINSSSERRGNTSEYPRTDKASDVGGGTILQLPYKYAKSYMFRRATAAHYDGLVSGFSSLWVDPLNPEGGGEADPTYFLEDQAGHAANIVRTSVTQPGRGSHTHHGVGQMPVVLVTGSNELRCTPAVGCTYEGEQTSSQNTAEFREVVTEQNTGMQTTGDMEARNSVGFAEGDSDQPFDGRTYRPRTSERGGTGYNQLFQLDNDDNSIRVNISLNPRHREDYIARLFDESHFGQHVVKALGRNPWALPEASGPPTVHSGFVHRVEDYPDGYQLPARPSGVPVPGSGAPAQSGVIGAPYGYRQGWLTSAFLVGEDDDTSSTLHRHVNEHIGVNYKYISRWRMIRWPVSMEDMNWYLFRLPGGITGNGDFPESILAHTLSDVGSNWILGSGYVQSVAPVFNEDQYPTCYFLDANPTDDLDPFPAVGKAVCGDLGDGRGDKIGDGPDKGQLVEGREPIGSGELDQRLFPFEGKSQFDSHGPPHQQLGTLSHRMFEHSYNCPAIIETLRAIDSAAQITCRDSNEVGQQSQPNLVRAGVASPLDADDELPRSMNEFSFDIRERDYLGGASLLAAGGEIERRYGVPDTDPQFEANPTRYRDHYEAVWPDGGLDPNVAHLLVVTYFEVLRDEGKVIAFRTPEDESLVLDSGYQTDSSGNLVDSDFASVSSLSETGLTLPQRFFRRVICRMLVYPAGFSPAASEGENRFVSAFKKVGGAIKDSAASLAGFFKRAFEAIGKVPLYLAKQGAGTACRGLTATDSMTGSGQAPATQTVTSYGVPSENQAGVDREAAIGECEKVSVEDVPSCRSGTDVILRGECINLPKMVLEVAPIHSGRNFFINPGPGGIDWPIHDVGISFDPINFDPYPYGDEWTRGLTELRVDIRFAWDSVDTGLYRGVDGYAIFVEPDHKLFQFGREALEVAKADGRDIALSFPGGAEGSGYYFILPEQIYTSFSEITGQSTLQREIHTVDGFHVGAINQTGEVPPYGRGPRSRVAPFSYAAGSPHALVSMSNRPVGHEASMRGLGGELVHTQMEWFNRLLGRMPLTAGFVHSFRVASYVGVPGSDTFVLGPWSDPLVLDGNTAACHALLRNDSSGEFLYTGLGGRVDTFDMARVFYSCQGFEGVSDFGFVEDDYRIGLLGLVGSDLCGDLFSATPPIFTWDNEFVQRVWSLMWVLAGAVFFSLLIWHALRMTYDIWLDPRPSMGFREMLPRFLLALVLAAGSFYICKWGIILVSDLTCFVAQATGMTLWGAVSKSFMILVGGFLQLFSSYLGIALIGFFAIFLSLWVLGAVVLMVFGIILYLFLKVVLAMLVRLALIALLICVSPVAFAMFASDATAHWTKRWVSMFLGALFQQALVLIVIYIGGGLLGYYLEEAGEQDSLFVFLVGSILAIMSLAVADKIPGLVNPAGEGLFSSFGEIAKMGIAAGMMVASAGAGAAAGLAGAGGGGAGAVSGGPGSGVAGGSVGGQGPGGSSAGGQASSSSPSGSASGGGGGGASAGSSSGGGNAGTSSGGGFGSRVGSAASGAFQGLQRASDRTIQGARQGMTRGQQYNTRMRNVTDGNFLHRNASHGDDAAEATREMNGSINRLLNQLGSQP